MARIVTNNRHYYSIARAIREKLGEDTLFKPSEMPPAIRRIAPIEKSAVTISMSASQNGTYQTVSAGYAFDNVTVDVDTFVPTETLSVSSNGSYYPTEGYLFDSVVASIPISDMTKESLTIYHNGFYKSPKSKAYDPVTISVPQYTIVPLSISKNGVYYRPYPYGDSHLFDPVTVDIPPFDRRDFYSVFSRNISIVSNSEIYALRDYMFYKNAVLTNADLPLIRTIGSNAFYECVNFSSISCSKVTRIGQYAFYKCQNMSTARFDSCSVIESSAFLSCSRLMSLYLMGSSVVSIVSAADIFAGTPIGGYSDITGDYGTIYVPRSIVGMYYAYSAWRPLSSLISGI